LEQNQNKRSRCVNGCGNVPASNCHDEENENGALEQEDRKCCDSSHQLFTFELDLK
jgi:hypothetical protein